MIGGKTFFKEEPDFIAAVEKVLVAYVFAAFAG